MTIDDPSGFIFDVQRLCLHDGPGIRTTVFLQGCPLRCLWCHNPEGQSQGRAISYRREACSLCRTCEEVCEQGAHSFEDGQHRYDRSVCKRCGKCVQACVFGALSVAGDQRRVSQVMSIVLRDQAYYHESGGGLTLSGGEPLFQTRFTQALLRSAKESGIHTCVETCGEAPQTAFERILSLVDLFLFDFKAADPKRHKDLSGMDNRCILANLDFLYRNGADIRLRCPLIPGLNDTPDDLRGISALAGRYPRLQGVEIMPYHDLGHQKYLRFGIPDRLPNLPKPDEETKQRWVKSLQGFGCPKAYVD